MTNAQTLKPAGGEKERKEFDRKQFQEKQEFERKLLNLDERAAASASARPDFVETPAVKEIMNRALGYLDAGLPVHFRGPAGTGKTTLALHVAAQRGRPVMLIAGDEDLRTADMVGGQFGYRYKRVTVSYTHLTLPTKRIV